MRAPKIISYAASIIKSVDQLVDMYSFFIYYFLIKYNFFKFEKKNTIYAKIHEILYFTYVILFINNAKKFYVMFNHILMFGA